jgi:threonine dehydrogenase-like Zn-dependent dehydrogenase
VTTNLALVRRGTGSRLEDRPVPSPRPGQRLARVLRAGVCGTDLQIQRRVRPDAATVLGHEGLAELVDPDTGGSWCAVFNPVDATEQDRVLGHSYDGLFQQLLLVDERGPDLLTAAPGLLADLAPLVEPLAAVLYGWELLGREPACVAVWGAGSTAVLAALVGELRGVPTHLVHPRPERLRFLAGRELFGTTALHTGLRGVEVDAAFLCLPREAAPAALADAAAALGPHGVVDLLGGFAPGDRHPAVPDVDLGEVRRANACGRPRPGVVVRRGAIGVTGHRGTARRHLEGAQRLLLDHPERFGPGVTHVVSLEAAARELPALAGRGHPSTAPAERIKVLVDPTLAGDAHRRPALSTTVGELGAAA